MNDRVRGARRLAGVEPVEPEMRGQRVEDLTAVGEVGDQRVDAGEIERLQIDIHHRIAARDEVGDDVPSGLAAPSREHHPLDHRFLPVERRLPQQ